MSGRLKRNEVIGRLGLEAYVFDYWEIHARLGMKKALRNSQMGADEPKTVRPTPANLKIYFGPTHEDPWKYTFNREQRFNSVLHVLSGRETPANLSRDLGIREEVVGKWTQLAIEGMRDFLREPLLDEPRRYMQAYCKANSRWGQYLLDERSSLMEYRDKWGG